MIDPSRLDPALGSPDEFDALLEELVERDMALLIDFVPVSGGPAASPFMTGEALAGLRAGWVITTVTLQTGQ